METSLAAAGPGSGESETGKLGLWLFLASEMMLFGGFLACYVMMRLGNSACALGTPAWPKPGYAGGLALAGLNTLVLITSSYTMVRALASAKSRDAAGFSGNLKATVVLGCLFLLVKAFEYVAKVHHGYYPGGAGVAANPGLGIFVSFYFAMTGLHGLHVLAGIAWNLLLLASGRSGEFPEAFVRKAEYAGLYWHFVDVVWVFLFPLFYLI